MLASGHWRSGCRERAAIQQLEPRQLLSVNVTLDASQQFQTMVGFGTALYSDTSAAPYDATAGSAEYNNFINDYASDLGNNLLRIDFDPDVLPNQPATPLGTNLQANIAQLNLHSLNAKFFGSLAQAINNAEGGKLQVLATIWSPPAWMKADDSLTAPPLPAGVYTDSTNHLLFEDNNPADNDLPTNNLDPTNLTQFARYCAAYVAGMEQTYGINIVGLSIQNEPMFDESYDSCSYYQTDTLDPTDIQYRRYAQAVQAVGGELYGDGLKTTIMGPESVGPDGNTVTPPMTERQMDYIQAIEDDTTVDAYGKTAIDYMSTALIHGWTGDGVDPSSDRDWWQQYADNLAAQPVQLPSWQTEMETDTTSWLGTTSTGAANPLRGALGLAMDLHDEITYGDISAYLYWQTADGHQTANANDLMDSTAATAADPERSDVPQYLYDVFKHWSRYVASGSVRIGANYFDDSGNAIAEDPTTVNTDAYANAANHTLTVEFTNESATPETVNLTIANTAVAEFSQAWLTDAASTWTSLGIYPVTNAPGADGTLTITLPGYSVVTLQGNTAVGAAAGVVYNDANANGQMDSGETGIAGATVFLDLNNDDTLDSGDPQMTTAADGSFSFPVLDAGSYTARAIDPPWRQTSPASGAGFSFTVAAGKQSAVDFGLTEAPPVAVINGPYSVGEGGSVMLSAAGSYEAAGSISSYQWDLNYNGTTFDPTASGETPTFSAAGLDGPSARTIALQVTGSDGLTSALVQTTITINNVPPTAAFTGGTVTLGQAATVTFSNQADPSPADVAAGFTYDYDFTDGGSFDIVGSTSPTATVPAADLSTVGPHVVAGRIIDKDGGYTDYTTTVIVTSPPIPTTGNVSGYVLGGSGGIGGVTVYLDANNNGQFDSNELSTTTSAGGAYSFTAVPPGAYIVRQILPAGQVQTSPANNYGNHIAVVAGGSLTNENFTDSATAAPPVGSISGAVATAGGVGVSNITVYLDANNNGVLDAQELSATTASNGAYSFANVPAGAYIVRQILPAGDTQSSPTNNYGIHLTVLAGIAFTGENFVDTVSGEGGSVSGVVELSNGQGIAGVVVYLDANSNSKLDAGELSTTTTASGAYSFSNVPAGAYIVRQVLPGGYFQLTPGNNYGDHISVTAGGSVVSQNFVDSTGASIAGTLFLDSNGDGKDDDGETGLSGWTLYIDLSNSGSYIAGDPTETTDANGDYLFSGLAAGTYIVRVKPVSGYSQTLPTQNYGQYITVAAGQAVSGVMFGEKKSG